MRVRIPMRVRILKSRDVETYTNHNHSTFWRSRTILFCISKLALDFQNFGIPVQDIIHPTSSCYFIESHCFLHVPWSIRTHQLRHVNGSLCFEEEDSTVSEVEVDEMFRLCSKKINESYKIIDASTSEGGWIPWVTKLPKFLQTIQCHVGPFRSSNWKKLDAV